MVLNRSLTMDVVSSNSCKNKEYILIGQIFDRTLSIFRFLNVRLQHKNGRTCPMTDRYLHHCNFCQIWVQQSKSDQILKKYYFNFFLLYL